MSLVHNSNCLPGKLRFLLHVSDQCKDKNTIVVDRGLIEDLLEELTLSDFEITRRLLNKYAIKITELEQDGHKIEVLGTNIDFLFHEDGNIF